MAKRRRRVYVAYQVVCPNGKAYGDPWRRPHDARYVEREIAKGRLVHRIGGWESWRPPCKGPHAIVVLRGTR